MSARHRTVWASQWLFGLALTFIGCAAPADPSCSAPSLPERIGLSPDKRTLVRQPSGRQFTPWGFNYDRDYRMRLIEDYWIDEWDTVESDFREMKALGANIVRIHLSLGQILDAPDQPNAANLAQLSRLVALCERIGVYLDVTGLGMYRKVAAPAWYMNVDEAQRWRLQARFWSLIAQACGNSPAVAWYDLANEPVVPGEKQRPGDWARGQLGEFWYCQVITLDPAGRDRGEIARTWVRQMSAAIRAHDPDALITVGMLPFGRKQGEPSIGFDAFAMRDVLDLLCVHVYPHRPPFEAALTVLGRFDVGKPLVIEEFFPMHCEPTDLPSFIEASKKHADGWIGFYWGQSPDELAKSPNPTDGLTLGWLKVFQSLRPEGVQ